MAAKKIVEAGTIRNTFFAEQADKTTVRLAGIIKEIEDKETPTGTAKRFKGDFALEFGETIYRAKYAFFPAGIRDALTAALSKIKWDTAEFVFTAVKSQDEKSSFWSVTFNTAPRVEQPRVLGLLS